MPLKSKGFIAEAIEVQFDKPPAIEKKPPCPDGFSWRGDSYRVLSLLEQWRDYSRRGSMQHTMKPANLRKAARRGSWGVGRFYFRVQTDNGQFFELYYDRAPKDIDNRKGNWVLFQELVEE